MVSNFRILFLSICLISVFTACKENEVLDTNSNQIEITSVKLNTNEMVINEGSSKELVVTIYPEDIENKNVKWSSDSPENAIVDEHGKVTGVKAGIANIKVELEGSYNTDVCKVIVKELVKATSINFLTSDVRLEKGDKYKLEVSLEPSGVTEELEWQSSAPDIVSVDMDGNINALNVGVCSITVRTVLSGLEAVCNVEVYSNTIEYKAEDIKIGDYFYSDGTVSDGGLRELNLTTGNQNWETSKPAPLSGKELIGIVFSTDENRISQYERDNGWSSGLVVAVKNVTNGLKGQWCTENEYYDFPEIPNINASSLIDNYNLINNDINGYYYNQILIENDYSLFTQINELNAPDNTSGWYLPSVGQWLDIYRAVFGINLNDGVVGFTGAPSNQYLPIWKQIASINESRMNSFSEYLQFTSGSGYWTSSEMGNGHAYKATYNTNDNSVLLDALIKNDQNVMVSYILSFSAK